MECKRDLEPMDFTIRKSSDPKPLTLKEEILNLPRTGKEYLTYKTIRLWLCRGAWFIVPVDSDVIEVFIGPNKKRIGMSVGTFSKTQDLTSHDLNPDGEDEESTQFRKKLIAFFMYLCKNYKVRLDRPGKFNGCSKILECFDGFQFEADRL